MHGVLSIFSDLELGVLRALDLLSASKKCLLGSQPAWSSSSASERLDPKL